MIRPDRRLEKIQVLFEDGLKTKKNIESQLNVKLLLLRFPSLPTCDESTSEEIIDSLIQIRISIICVIAFNIELSGEGLISYITYTATRRLISLYNYNQYIVLLIYKYTITVLENIIPLTDFPLMYPKI